MARYRLRLLPTMITHFPDKSWLMYRTFGSPVSGTNYVYYLEDADKNIIIDTGSPVEFMKVHSPPGFGIEGRLTFEEALDKIGLKPSDIDIVILTHLHTDHFLNVSKCTNAEIYVQEEEMKFALSPHPLWASIYNQEGTEKLRRMKGLRLIRGDKEIVDGVRVLFTPGHSPGGQSVLVETAKGDAIIGAFCCLKENFFPPEPISSVIDVIPPGIHTDSMQAYDSLLRVKNTAKILVPLIDGKNPERIP